MRSRHALVATLAILVMVASVAIGGHVVLQQKGSDIERQAEPATVPAEQAEPSTAAVAKEPTEKAPVMSRVIDPEMVAPPRVGGGELERAAPRAPLSDLALATPPKPKLSGDWKGTTLFRPFASSAGVVAAQRYLVTIAGIEIVRSDETCLADGTTWNCGAHALGAFRAFLRGLAVVCAIPDDKDRGDFTVRCRSGKRDVGEWLVENGWARASAGGPYTEAQAAATKAKKGIFGAAPDLSGLPAAVEAAPEPPMPQAPISIIEEPAPEATPPTGQPEPFQ